MYHYVQYTQYIRTRTYVCTEYSVLVDLTLGGVVGVDDHTCSATFKKLLSGTQMCGCEVEQKDGMGGGRETVG